MNSLWFNENALVTKTTGFSALMLALPTVFEQTARRYESFELQHVEKVLYPIRAVPWSGRELAGQQGTVAARKLAELLEKAVISGLAVEEANGRKHLSI